MASRAGGEAGRRDKVTARRERGAAGGRPARPKNMEPALLRHYAGEPVPCPVACGGTAEVVRRGSRDAGGGELWFECGSCAQRSRYEVPGPTPSERRWVLEMVAAGRTADCPRHAEPITLDRLGRRMVCPDCGIVFEE